MTAIERELMRFCVERWPHPDWDAPFSTVIWIRWRELFARNLPGAGGLEVWKLFHVRQWQGTETTLITSVSHLRELLTSKGITNVGTSNGEQRTDRGRDSDAAVPAR